MPEPQPGRPAPDVEPRSWREIGADLVRPSRSQLVLGVILLLFGLAVTMQLSRPTDQRWSTLRQDDLVAMLDDVTGESRRLESEIAELERTRTQLESGANAREVAQAEARRRLDALELLGGTVPATGAGVRISIVDQAGRLTPEILLNAIEELRDAGAEVIEIDDRIRLVAGSWIGGTAGAIQVDGVPLDHTVRIEAIGNPQTLDEATRFRGGLVSTIEGDRVGGRATVEALQSIDITSVVEPTAPRFARPG